MFKDSAYLLGSADLGLWSLMMMVALDSGFLLFGLFGLFV
jgi:hypothetical protein